MNIKFICLNLWLGGKLFDPMLDFLKEEKPDILALQEIYDGKDPRLEKRFRSLEVLRKELGLLYDFFSPTCIDVRAEGKIENGNAIFSRFPIVNSNTIFFDIPFGERTDFEGGGDYSFTPRNMQRAEIKLQNANLNVFNTQGIWGFDGEDNERRLKMSDTIISAIRGKKNILLCGDFNVRSHTKTILNIEKHLDNIFKDELRTTFNMKYKNKPSFASSVVDMIFTSKNLKVTDHYCPNVDISDHLPLVCIFEI
jgi:endonuclease/exonuclease/phosphatase family metal-dependent hydrolase